jgi:hypothetical protein
LDYTSQSHHKHHLFWMFSSVSKHGFVEFLSLKKMKGRILINIFYEVSIFINS